MATDQIGNPTYTLDLAELLVDMITTEKYGNYHATNEGDYISWYDFTKEIYRQAGLKTKVIPVSTEEYGLSKAKRPKNSRLDKKKLRQQGVVPRTGRMLFPDILKNFLRKREEKALVPVVPVLANKGKYSRIAWNF